MLFLLTAIALVPQLVQAEIYLPRFDPNRYFETAPTRRILDLRDVKAFRVLIFPHFGDYAVPQGREASAASVKVSSSENCDIYKAELDENDEWIKSGEKISSVKEVTLSAAQMGKFRKAMKLSAADADVLYYHCTAPFTVHRAKNLASISYSGSFIAFIKGKNVNIVNLVDPEIYLKGVIPTEVGATWPMEVLKAQAVAARTYAWNSLILSRGNTANYDMDDTVSYQAYMGNDKRTEATDQAADATAGEILKYDGLPIIAYFSADSGGYTESAIEGFGRNLPYCQAKKEFYDQGRITSLPSDKVNWTKSFTAATMQTTLAKFGVIPYGVKVHSIEVGKKTTSGRADTLIVKSPPLKKSVTKNGKTTTQTVQKVYTVSGSKFRYATKLRSVLFSISKNKAGSFTFIGKGYGHGVGMAQIGALEHHTQLGWDYLKILDHYYTGAKIEKTSGSSL